MHLQGLIGNRATGRVLSASGGRQPSRSDPGGPGQPLPPVVRLEMEQRFGADFGGVRVHAGANAQRLLHEWNADAATIGDAIAMTSAWVPGSRADRRLLTHERAHVIQQRRGGERPRPLPGSSVEQGADRAAAAFDGDPRAISRIGASRIGVARQPVAPARSRTPATMSIGELELEIRFLEQWLLDVSQSSGERVCVEMYLGELRGNLAARQPVADQDSAARTAPQRSTANIWADQALAWLVRRIDDAQAQFSQSMRNLAADLPPAQFAMVNTAIGMVDAIFDTFESSFMFAVGIVAGTVELVADTIVGIGKLAWLLFEMLAGLVGELIEIVLRQVGVDARYQGKSGSRHGHVGHERDWVWRACSKCRRCRVDRAGRAGGGRRPGRGGGGGTGRGDRVCRGRDPGRGQRRPSPWRAPPTSRHWPHHE